MSRATRRARAHAPAVETEADKIQRLRATRALRDAGLLPVVARMEAPKGVRPVLTQTEARERGLVDRDAPALDMVVIDRLDRVPPPPPARHDPSLDAARDAFMRRKTAEIAATLTPEQMAVLKAMLAANA